jgi:general secretion pathway protein L
MKSGITRMSTLILTLPDQALKPSVSVDYVISRDGQSLDTQSSAPWSLLPASARAAQATQVILVVPVQRLSWHQVQLPQGLARSPRLRAALEGMLEEHVLDDVSDLHLALQTPLPAQGPAWLAACDKAWLLACVQEIEQAGLRIAALVPELAPQTFAPGAGDAQAPTLVYALAGPQGPQLVSSSPQGLIRWPLQASAVALLKLPDNALVFAEPAVAAQAEQILGNQLVLQTAAQRALLASQGPWDLAQFGIVTSRGSRGFKRLSHAVQQLLSAPRWRLLRFSLWTLLLVQLIGLNLYAYQQQAALNQQKQAMQAVLKSTFSSVQVVVDAPVQMQREVERLRQSSGQLADADAQVMLSALMQVANYPPPPQAIDYQAGELKVTGLLLAELAKSDLRRSLQARGYQLQTQGDVLLMRWEAKP